MGLFLAAKKVIQTKKAYTLEEVRDTLNEQGGFPSEAVIGGVMGSKGVYFITFMGNDVWLRVQEAKITVTLRQMPTAGKLIGGVVGGLVGGVISAVASGKTKSASWNEYLGKEKYRADDIVFAVAEKAEQYFGLSKAQ